MKIAIAYACGSFGGIAAALLIWLFGFLQITAFFGVAIAPDLTPEWLYSRAVWGGLWGGLFLLPLLARQPWYSRAMLFSFAPTLVTWFIVFPLKSQAGLLGLELGNLTPFFVIAFNMSWAFVTAAAIKWIPGE